MTIQSQLILYQITKEWPKDCPYTITFWQRNEKEKNVWIGKSFPVDLRGERVLLSHLEAVSRISKHRQGDFNWLLFSPLSSGWIAIEDRGVRNANTNAASPILDRSGLSVFFCLCLFFFFFFSKYGILVGCRVDGF